MAKFLDQNGLLYLWQHLKTMFAGKVDTESGKGLSTNDYTNADKSKLDGIAAGAEENVIEGITVNGTAATVTGKVAEITVPSAVTDLSDSDDYATKTYVEENGGKIDVIKVNGTAQTITNKAVDIAVPSVAVTNPSGQFNTIKLEGENKASLEMESDGDGMWYWFRNASNLVDKSGQLAHKSYVDNNMPTKTSDLTNDSGFITAEDVPDGAVASTTTPGMDGTAAVGTETAFARGDHIHPTDTSRAPLDSPAFTGAPTAPRPDSNDNSGRIATTDFVQEKFTVAVAKAVDDAVADAAAYTDSAAQQALAIIEETYVEKTALIRALDIIEGTIEETCAKKTDITNVYKYKGSVATQADLPDNDLIAGDVYNVEATGMNYAWTGTAWDPLGASFSIDAITNAEIDTILAS